MRELGVESGEPQKHKEAARGWLQRFTVSAILAAQDLKQVTEVNMLLKSGILQPVNKEPDAK